MSCLETFLNYALRAIGIGERILPKTEITLCEQIVLIGSGMIWNIYFLVLAILFGFFTASFTAFARASKRTLPRNCAAGFIFLFRGSPMFIQFFVAYEAFVLMPKLGWEFSLFGVEIGLNTKWLTRAWLGALIVLFLNTTAYSAQIFYAALRLVPKGDIEAARALGLSKWLINRRIIWPEMLRLAWASYTNEAIFLFHATTLVFFSSFPAWRQQGDSLYFANYFAEKTFNPFISYPVIACFFVFFTLIIILTFNRIGRKLHKHTEKSA